MPRLVRVKYHNAFYHVMNHGGASMNFSLRYGLPHLFQSTRTAPRFHEISLRGRNDKGGVEVPEGQTWIPD